MDSTEKKLVDFLKDECTGEKNAVRKDWIASFYLGISTRRLRKLKQHIVLKHRIPIGSNKNGYFFAKNDHEIASISNEYVARIKEHSKMVRAYKYMIKNRYQLSL